MKAQDDKAINFAIKKLSYCDLTEYKLRAALKRKGFEEKEINNALSFLIEKNYINDERFAFNFINKCLREGKKGPKAILYELRKKGVKKNLSLIMIKQLIPEEKEIELINKLISKEKEKSDHCKIINKLLRKGFGKNAIRKAMVDKFKGIKQ